MTKSKDAQIDCKQKETCFLVVSPSLAQDTQMNELPPELIKQPNPQIERQY